MYRLTTLDAVVYGYFQALLSTVLPSNELAKVVIQFKNLTDFCSQTLPDSQVERQEADESGLNDSCV